MGAGAAPAPVISPMTNQAPGTHGIRAILEQLELNSIHIGRLDGHIITVRQIALIKEQLDSLDSHIQSILSFDSSEFDSSIYTPTTSDSPTERDNISDFSPSFPVLPISRTRAVIEQQRIRVRLSLATARAQRQQAIDEGDTNTLNLACIQIHSCEVELRRLSAEFRSAPY